MRSNKFTPGASKEERLRTYKQPPTSALGSHLQPDCHHGLGIDKAIPDGGLRAWLVVFGGFVNFTTGFGLLNSFGVFQGFYSHDVLAYESVATVAWIGSAQLFFMFIGGIFVGPAFDRWGARPVTITGSIIVVSSFICASFATEFYELLLSQGFLFGIGNAMLYYPTTCAITEWFDKRRGLAFGLAVSGSSIGGIVWPLAIAKLLRTAGFAWTNRALGLASCPLLGLACALVVERGGAEDCEAREGGGPSCSSDIPKEIFHRPFVTLSLSLFFIFTGMLVPFNWVPLYAQALGISAPMSDKLLPVCYAGSVIGRVSAGWAADRLGRFNMLIVLALGTSTLIFCWTVMTSLAGQISFAILYGLFSGGLIPLGSACVAQTSTNVDRIGLRIGAMMALCSPGTLTGNPVSGIIHDRLGWVGVHVFAASMVLVGVALLIRTRLALTPHGRAVI